MVPAHNISSLQRPHVLRHVALAPSARSRAACLSAPPLNSTALASLDTLCSTLRVNVSSYQWSASSSLHLALDKCTVNNGDCPAGSTCTPTGTGTNTCSCSANSDSCGADSVCTAAGCACVAGFVSTSSNGRDCVLDPCSLTICGTYSRCRLVEGVASCMCDDGYVSASADGITCIFDHCAVNNGGCGPNSTCTLAVSAESPPSCACDASFFSLSADGRNCVSNPCRASSCGVQSTCKPTSSSTFTCTCNAGYFSLSNSGTGCIINRCATVAFPCGLNSQCTPTGNNIITYALIT